jgi:hypothetical protein
VVEVELHNYVEQQEQAVLVVEVLEEMHLNQLEQQELPIQAVVQVDQYHKQIQMDPLQDQPAVRESLS